MGNENNNSFRVSEAFSKDIGKSIVRIDREEISNLGISIGDVVEINGKSIAVARVMPVYDEYKGKKLIQMDGVLRKNADVGMDESVTIQKAVIQDANTIMLSSISKVSIAHNNEDIAHLKHTLNGIPVLTGNTLRVKLLGYASQEYIVTATNPEGVVRICSESVIKIKSEGTVKKDSRISYEDIGGMDRQIQRIREMIELPLKYPEVFRKLGIEAPKGLLLYGPPGTGKTLIARAVANETNAYFIHVNGPEIINKFYGESEAKLREIFEAAGSNAPSIIFLDEIDAISPKRENVNGDVEKRVVAQLLALMDGMNDRGEVIVIGATNIPNAIDPALRRPGRFDREIEIGIPDRNGRLRILQVHTRDMPLDDTVDLGKLADLTHGYVGADIQSLCREAAMTALRKIFPKIDFSTSSIPYHVIENLKVTMDDFYASLNEIEPSAIREVIVEVPNTRFDDIGGLESTKKQIIQSMIWPEQYKELYCNFGCKAPRGILFYGAPGTGKTMLAKAIASLNNANFISVKGPELLSKWVGESEKGLREIFKKAKQAAPCVIFFDEIDSLVPKRGNESSTSERIICQMLTEMDGIEELKGVTVIGATNRLDIVDPALLRPGRFNMLLEFEIPDFNDRIEIFKIHLKGKPLAKDVDLVKLAQATDQCTGADIMEICQRAAMEALSEYVCQLANHENYAGEQVICYDNFIKVLESRR